MFGLRVMTFYRQHFLAIVRSTRTIARNRFGPASGVVPADHGPADRIEIVQSDTLEPDDAGRLRVQGPPTQLPCDRGLFAVRRRRRAPSSSLQVPIKEIR